MPPYVTRREAEAADALATTATLKADRRFLWLWLTVSTLLSVCGNIGHAWLTVPPGTAQLLAIGWAVAPPCLLMLAVHALPTLSRMMGSTTTDKLLQSVVWGVTAGAFGWSAFGIHDFTSALGVPTSLSWVAPAVIDLSVFGATRGLVLTSPIAARMKVGAQPQRTASPQVSKPPAPTTAPRQTPSTAPSPAPTAPRPASPGAPVTPRPAPSSAPQGSPSAPSPAPELVALASRIVESRAVRQPVSTVARILAMSESEGRKNVLAERVGVHHSVVTKVLAEAESQRRHGLVAVS
ncbi:hypothetical protein [Mycobacteroides abscessus]|uniref:Protein of uncharacterized function (DUF2637) n=1 Tax=Mycobacteroides abscessus subsp. abscessus TaxID=1185650 RepID=A0AB38CZL7_9MYCO|nr:hypothetical protein [Mycobacteroides abscessus]SHO86526.1 Protein of uncharacterised function (DUF2637) [Mycobacteroides abscessus subsp. abscessus]SHP07502.1 Protein of uncharacterised function (DUF2637) [Mycobacteroides abscessus subsp. abscessus]SHP38504.1 Protein of uncharacterised function (DUF2637) [Mycobacteroides abscessus subsp. abscessus]SHP46592.1 Protein of uncharacterised function (DUF2637) [Mycobacteroides abscessus subsp. abscessus]SHP47076.1 Protein of uncharacterised funct